MENNAIELFRQEVREFVRANLSDEIRARVAEEHMDIPKEDQRRWHRILQSRGWGCPSWPEAYGGPGWTDLQHYVFEREIALADAPRPMTYGIDMLAPTIMEYGTQQQKDERLPRIQNADDFWCQGFSETGAGSDLASLKCEAIRKGDRYIINGAKVWISEAHIADYMFGLFRTDASGKKQHGITFLLVDMHADGVEVKPIDTYEASDTEISEVFFNDVMVPVSNRVGEEHQGWGLAKYLLSLERFGTAEVSRSLRTLERLKEFAHRHFVGDCRLIDHPDFASRLGRAEIELRAIELTEYRMLFGRVPMGAEASLLKLKGTEIQNDILELFHDAIGSYSLLETSDPETLDNLPKELPDARYAARAHFNYRKTMIYAGSNEIQKNILAKAVLGL